VVPGLPPPSAANAAADKDKKVPEDDHELDLDLNAAKDSEWSGFTSAVKSDEPVFYAITSQKAWEKVWTLLSSEEAPKVDFGEKTIVGIIAGAKSKADTVRIIARRPVGESTVFDYYMTEAAGNNPAAPYIFKTYSKVTGKIDFKRLDVGGSTGGQ